VKPCNLLRAHVVKPQMRSDGQWGRAIRLADVTVTRFHSSVSLSIDNAQSFFMARRRDSNLVLVEDPTGIPTLVEKPSDLLRAEYVLGEDATDDRLLHASYRLSNADQMLLAMSSGLDGPQSRSAVAYHGSSASVEVWKDGSRSYLERLHGVRYSAVTTQSPVAWSHALSLRKPAYFLTGTPANANLWRIERTDEDVWHRYNFTLSPVQMLGGFPSLDFSAIKDDILRQEAETHWTELQDRIQRHSYYGAVTAAKDLMETLLVYELKGRSVRNMDGLLKKLGDVIVSDQNSLALRFTQLDIHLMHKLRLLHQRTHAGKVVTVGRTIRPGLALSVAEDVIEIVTSVGLSK
jgi:hypothetical protein